MLRNIFRYKKRLFMTILGVAGCTALIFAGFALRDSIKGIVGKQYETIQKFDVNIDLAKDSSEASVAGIHNAIEENGGNSFITAQRENLKIIADDKETGINLIAFQNEKYRDFFTLRNRQSGDDLSLPDEGILITEKIAKEYNLEVGDTARFKNEEGNIFEAEIKGITENYINHYIFLSFKAYEDIFDKKPSGNTIFVNLKLAEGQDEYTFSSKILALEGIGGVSLNIQNKNLLNTSLKTLDFVVLVLILSAVALVFVVLFSLTSINIEERKRELATLKVLGFRKMEMISYIFKEIFILTIIGTALGLILGFFIQRYIISTMETSILMFSRDINFTSYLFSILLTLTFAGIVNLAMFRQVTKIDMVSSLKSIE